MRITTKNIHHPITGTVSPSSKFLIIDEYLANPRALSIAPIKILIGVTYRTFDGENINRISHTPDKAMYEASLVITTDVMARNFSISKNRYGDNNYKNVPSKIFLNQDLKSIICQMVEMSDFHINQIVASIIQVISEITGEVILFIDGEWKTMRDMYMDKTIFIKRKTYKHNFTDARIS